MEKKTEQMIKELVSDLKDRGVSLYTRKDNPDERINIWWVIARLEAILLEGK